MFLFETSVFYVPPPSPPVLLVPIILLLLKIVSLGKGFPPLLECEVTAYKKISASLLLYLSVFFLLCLPRSVNLIVKQPLVTSLALSQ